MHTTRLLTLCLLALLLGACATKPHPLYEAIRRADVAAVDAMLTADPSLVDVESRCGCSGRPLDRAIGQDHSPEAMAAIVRRLIHAGADVNSFQRGSPLVEAQHPDVFDALMEAKLTQRTLDLSLLELQIERMGVVEEINRFGNARTVATEPEQLVAELERRIARLRDAGAGTAGEWPLTWVHDGDNRFWNALWFMWESPDGERLVRLAPSYRMAGPSIIAFDRTLSAIAWGVADGVLPVEFRAGDTRLSDGVRGTWQLGFAVPTDGSLSLFNLANQRVGPVSPRSTQRMFGFGAAAINGGPITHRVVPVEWYGGFDWHGVPFLLSDLEDVEFREVPVFAEPQE